MKRRGRRRRSKYTCKNEAAGQLVCVVARWLADVQVSSVGEQSITILIME